MMTLVCPECGHEGEVLSNTHEGQEVICSVCNATGLLAWADNGEAFIKTWDEIAEEGSQC